MTIERARDYFGLFSWHKTIESRSIFGFKENGGYIEIKVVSPDLISLETITIPHSECFGADFPNLRSRATVLRSDQVNEAKIQRSPFPGIRERIIWSPPKSG